MGGLVRMRGASEWSGDSRRMSERVLGRLGAGRWSCGSVEQEREHKARPTRVAYTCAARRRGTECVCFVEPLTMQLPALGSAAWRV